MIEGIIYKGIGGFYYVKSGNITFECRARGKFKIQNLTPLVGDRVLIQVTDAETCKGVVEEILPRSSELVRPSVANVTQVIVVFSIKDPMPNAILLDKLLVAIEEQELKAVICFNKIDLDDTLDYEKYRVLYEKVGYRVIKTCSLTGEGLEDLFIQLKDHISVFSGPSGVGKSSMLNALHQNFELETGGISEKIKRGKHTTRHSELFELNNGGIVVDTPGFSSFSVLNIESENLHNYYLEIERIREHCYYDNCQHINEPKCAVKKAVELGEISQERYRSYLYVRNEIEQIKGRDKKW